MIGYQRYQPGKPKTKIPDAEKRYYTYSIPDSYPVWGVESLAWPGPIFMLEGIFDACRLHHFFLPALAIFGNDSKHLVPWFKAMNREVIAICDNDDDFAGLKLSKASTRSICLIKWKDLGEMNCDEISNLLKYFM